MTKLSGNLPKGTGDGLSMFGERFVQYPSQPVVVVAVLDTHRITTDLDNGTQEPTLRIDMIERVDPEDLDLAKGCLRRAREKRSGFQEDQLPIDVADKLDQLFEAAGMDPRSFAEMVVAEARKRQGALFGDAGDGDDDDDGIVQQFEAMAEQGVTMLGPDGRSLSPADAAAQLQATVAHAVGGDGGKGRGSRAKRGKGGDGDGEQ